jgi:hypothetical protein
MSDYRTVTFTDELLADGSVHRRYSDGREEWRRRGPDGIVQWRDSVGGTGTDEPLAERLIKRTYSANGRTVYGRDQGYGRTAWGDRTLTVNRTTFGGRMGVVLAAIGGGLLLGAIVAPPLALTAGAEEELRQQLAQQKQAQQQSSSNDGGGSGGGGDGGDSGGSGDPSPGHGHEEHSDFDGHGNDDTGVGFDDDFG